MAKEPYNGNNSQQPDPMSWDNMKDDIFASVLEQDPNFFTPRKHRRAAWIIWPVAAAGVIAIIASIWVVNSNTPAGTLTRAVNKAEQIKILSDISDSNTIQSSENPAPYATTLIPIPNTGNHIASSANHNKNESTKSSELSSVASIGESDRAPEALEKYADRDNNSAQSLDQKILGQTVSIDDNLNSMPARSDSEFDRLPSLTTLVDLDHAFGTIPAVAPPQLQEVTTGSQCLWHVDASAGGLFSSSKLSGTSGAVDLRNGSTSSLFGYTGRLGAKYHLGKSWQLGLGLSYAQAYQTIDISTEREIEVERTDVLLSVTHFVVGNRRLETYGDTTVAATEKNRLLYTNTFRWLYLDLGVHKAFQLSNWEITPAIGAAYGRLWSDGYTVGEDGQIIKFENAEPIHARSSIKVMAQLAIARKINERMRLNIVYRADKQLNNGSLESGVIFKPLFHELALGLQVALCKKN